MLSKRFFEKNRKRLLKEMKDDSLAVFFSKDQIMKGDSEFFDFQDPNIFYFTGIEQAKSKLLVLKTKDRKDSLLFIEKGDKYTETWIGKRLEKEEAKVISGIGLTYFLEEFETKFEDLCKKVKNIYFFADEDYDSHLNEYKSFIRKTKRKHKKNYINIASILRKLRSIKSKEEIEALRTAAEISRKAHIELMKNLKKIKNEKEAEAILSYVYTKKGAKHSYQPICAAGKNACILHYVANDKELKEGELLLVDSGAEINNYKSDITRTYPISGRFTKRQKEVYEAVLRIQEFAIEELRPKVKRRDYERKVRAKMGEELHKLGLLSEEESKDLKNTIEYYPHSTGHYLGLDTHDLQERESTFKEGVVITVEPGIYIKEEKIGIRIEDNILITKKGPINLSEDIPKSVKEIEKTMKRVIFSFGL